AAMAAAAWAHTVYLHPHLLTRLGFGVEEPFAGAVGFLDRAGVRGRMFNEYESGGPLIYMGHPARKVFIDGRNVEYGPELVRAALSWHRPEVWKALDGRYRFDYAVIRRHVSGAYTSRVLDELPEWRLVYWDDEAMVYLRDTEEHAGLIARHGYELVRPGRGNYQYLEPLLREPASSEGVLEELDRALEQAPHGGCVIALLMKAYVLARAGRAGEAAESAAAAVRLRPAQAQPRFTLGWVHETAGDFGRAEAAYAEALARVGRGQRRTLGADILNNRGRALERRGDAGGAVRSYRKALRWNPRQGDALRNLRRLEGR
ncbi:MAG: tetratricopeptide repeat protein, partial [Elusimicrobiota bacterium]